MKKYRSSIPASKLQHKKTSQSVSTDEKAIAAAIAAFNGDDVEPMLCLCQKKLARDPHDYFACTNLGVIKARAGRYDEASALYRAGLEKHPNDATLHANFSRTLCECRQWSEAWSHASKATELDPKNATAWVNLTWACNMLGRHREGEQAARRALELQPGQPIALNNLAAAVKEQGHVHESVALYREVIERDPVLALGYANLLLALQYDESATVNEMVQVGKDFAVAFEAPLKSLWPDHDNQPAPWRRLQVAFLSPDFNDHSVMYFAEPLFTNLDRNRYELVCYYLYPRGSGDYVTERVKGFCDRFVYLGGYTPAEQAAAIQADHIDILIDLAGHTGKNGLLAMARKPAPVQMTWMGYPGTTGLTAVDWRITDKVADRDVEELKIDGLQENTLQDIPPLMDQYSEKLAFIPPPFCVYRPCIRNPLQRYSHQYKVQAAPALKNGFITFGSCNNIAKLTPNVLQAWSRLLERLPTAHLLIEGKGFDDASVAAACRDKYLTYGLPVDRLDLIPRDTGQQYLTYHKIDIALDPFPLTGGTTSFDVLWMGVPLVTMAGESFRSRMGISILTAAGLTDWIARDEEEYIDIAVRMASDIPALHARRMQQQKLIEASPLMDESRFARLFEEVLRQAWLKWCAEKVSPDNPQSQFQQWLLERPTQPPVERQVFLAPGERVGLTEARNRLQQAFEGGGDGNKVVRLAKLILESIPKEPLSLAILAETEYVQGRKKKAIAYLYHALEAAPHNASFYHRLAHWLTEAGNPQGAEQILQLMQQRGVC